MQGWGEFAAFYEASAKEKINHEEVFYQAVRLRRLQQKQEYEDEEEEEAKEEKGQDVDEEELGEFLRDKRNLKTIWNQFNKNEDDVLDRAEFDRLLFTSLKLFMKERDPDMTPPTRDAMDPYIEKLRNELAPRVDTDGDGVISFEEFKTFGEC